MTASLNPVAQAAAPRISFDDMADDFDFVPTAAPLESGRAKLHAFERAGLGLSPFRATHCTAGSGNCAFCGQGLKYLFHVVSGDGKAFIVGSDCVERAGAEVANFGSLSKSLARQKSAAAKKRKAERASALAAEVFAAWKAENGALHEFLESRPADDFCRSLLAWVGKHGALTPGQQGAADRMMVRHAAWEAERAQKREAQAVEAPVVSIDAITAAFARALQSGIKRPKLRIADFQFKMAPDNGKNAGAVYVTQAKGSEDEGAYLGKVMGGKFLKVGDCTDAKRDEVVAVCSDPKAAAIAHGKKFGICSACSRELTDPASIEAGIGPICAENYGW